MAILKQSSCSGLPPQRICLAENDAVVPNGLLRAATAEEAIFWIRIFKVSCINIAGKCALEISGGSLLKVFDWVHLQTANGSHQLPGNISIFGLSPEEPVHVSNALDIVHANRVRD